MRSSDVDNARPFEAGTATAVPASTGRTAVLLVVVGTLFLMLALPVRAWFAQQSEIRSLEQRIDATRTDVEQLKQERELWKDSAYVEVQARERLGYVRPGEIGLVAVSAEAEEGDRDQAGNWLEQLWHSVEVASGRSDAGTAGEPIEVRDDAPR